MIPAAPVFATYTGDGTTTVFNFTFRIYLAADVKVYTFDAGSDTIPQLVTSGYSVTLLPDYSGGSITFATAPASGIKIGILRATDLTQDIGISNTDYVPPSTIEKQMDRQVMMAQEAALRSSSALSSDPFNFTLALRSGKSLVFDANGNPAYSLVSGGGSGTLPTDVMRTESYDPGNKHTDVFSMDNMNEGTNTKIMTAAERTKLAGIAAGAQVNVQADWNGAGAAAILNKPTLATVATTGQYSDLLGKPAAPVVTPGITGFPDASNTGPLAGTVFTTYTGPMTITAANTTISNQIINGDLVVNALGVVISNCIINQNSYYGVDASGAGGPVTIQNCRIVGPGKAGTPNSAILGSGTFTNNDISWNENGISLQDGASTVSGNYIHDLLTGAATPHVDGIQAMGGQNGVVISGNTIVSYDNSCVFLKNTYGTINNVTIENNLLLGTAGYPVFVDGRDVGGPITSVSVTGNTVQHGGFDYYSVSSADVTISGNTELPAGSGDVPKPGVPSAASIFNVKTFGARGDGLTDDTYAIQKAVDACLNGGTVYLPAGKYLTTAAINVSHNGTQIIGDGSHATIIVPSTASQDCFVFYQSGTSIEYCSIRHMRIEPTAGIGSAVKVRNHYWFIAENVFVAGNHLVGFEICKGSVAYNCILHDCCSNGSTSAGARLGLTDTGDLQNVFLFNCHFDGGAAYGLAVYDCGGLNWAGGECLNDNVGLYMYAGTASTDRIKGVYVSHVFFDTCTADTMQLSAGTNSANYVEFCTFSDCSFNASSTANGVNVGGPSARPGAISNLSFVGCHFTVNHANGAYLNYCTKVSFECCHFISNNAGAAASTHGLSIDHVTGCTVRGGSSGPGGEFTSNGQKAGIGVGTSAASIVINGVNVTGNVSIGIEDDTKVATIRDCIGHATYSRGVGKVASGTNNVTVNHGLPVLPPDQFVRISPITLTSASGITSYGSSNLTATTFKVNTNVNTSSDWYFFWEITAETGHA